MVILTHKEIVKKLEKRGWKLRRRKGSHLIFKRDGVSYVITVPFRVGDVSAPIVAKILKQIKEKKHE